MYVVRVFVYAGLVNSGAVDMLYVAERLGADEALYAGEGCDR